MATKINDTKDKLEHSAANMDRAASKLENMDYDVFKQGEGYDGLKKSYEQQGRMAMQDTIGQVAARTGGMASSFAQTAGQQAYNAYMQTLEDAARSLYNSQRQEKLDNFSVAGSLYDRDHSADRERVGDKQWQDSFDYQKDRDRISDDRYDAQEEEKLKAQAQADVMAIWASGGTPTREQLIDAGWYDSTNSLSPLGNAYRKQIEINNYRYRPTAEGAEKIVNALVGSATNTLNDKDIDNFDYIYGDGAYDAVQAFISDMSSGNGESGFKNPREMTKDDFESQFNLLFESLASQVPGLSSDQIWSIIEKVNPNAYIAATTEAYWDKG